MNTINITAVIGGFIAALEVQTVDTKSKIVIKSKPCITQDKALNSLRKVLKDHGLELPPNKELPNARFALNRPVNSTPAIQFTDSTPVTAPDTTRIPAPALEPESEPELNRLLKPVEGLISPLSDAKRWVAIYRGVVACYGNDSENIIVAMKNMNCASPWARDSLDRPFHMYSDNNLVPAPRPGEGNRRQLKNANGFNRDFMGRTPVEPGSLAMDTEAFHPANKPERQKGLNKADRMALGKAENDALRAASPELLRAKQLAKTIGSAWSRQQGGNSNEYKKAWVSVAFVLGGINLANYAKFMADLGLSAVSPDMVEWAKNALKDYTKQAA